MPKFYMMPKPLYGTAYGVLNGRIQPGTFAMANSVANSYALSIVGGGDTDVAVHESGETDRITYISTGGGAFLALLEGKILPAVAALDL